MRKSAVRPFLLVMASIVSACGAGGGDDFQIPSPVTSPTSPAKFSSTDEVAAIVFWASAGPQATYGTYRGVSSYSAPDAPAAKSRDSRAGAESMRSKATSRDCSDGGSETYEENTDTQYPFDGINVSRVCVHTDPSYPSITYTQDGQVVLTCTDVEQSDSCANLTTAYGASDRPYLFGFKDTRTPAVDVLTSLRLTDEVSYIQLESSTLIQNLYSGSMTLIDQLAKVSTNIYFDKFETAHRHDDNEVTDTFNGVFGVISSIAKCSVGKVTVRTLSPVTYQVEHTPGVPISYYSDKPMDGRLTITDVAGQSAVVQYNSDGSATITLGGASKLYSATELDSICN